MSPRSCASVIWSSARLIGRQSIGFADPSAATGATNSRPSGTVVSVVRATMKPLSGEKITSPRIQEYITWIAPKEKAGLYMGSNFLGTMIGATVSGIYAPMYGWFERGGNPAGAWYVLAGHMILAAIAFQLFVKLAGEFKIQSE